MMTLYDFMGSGNGYKVRLALAHLGLPYKLDRARHPEGRDAHAGVPGQEPQRPHPDAAARRRQLTSPNRTPSSGTSPTARGCSPPIRFARYADAAIILFEQYSHEPYVAVARFWGSRRA